MLVIYEIRINHSIVLTCFFLTFFESKKSNQLKNKWIKTEKNFMADKKFQRHENSKDYAYQRKEAVPQFLVIVSNAIKQQVVPPQKESSSNRFVNDLVTSLRESHSSDDFNGTEVIHVKPNIIEEAFTLFIAPIRDARHDIIK